MIDTIDRRYQISKLNHRHEQIMRLMLLGTMTKAQMARLTGYSPSSLGLIVNSPLFQEELSRRQTQLQNVENEEIASGIGLARSMAENAAVGAMEKLDDLCHSATDENVQLRAADSILKVAFGNQPAAGVQIGQIFVLDASKLAFLQQVANEAGLIDGTKREPTAEDPIISIPTTALAGTT